MFAALVIAPATFWGVDLPSAKAHCRADYTNDFDTEIQAMIKAATLHAEKTTRSEISKRTFNQPFPCFAPCMRLRHYPVLGLGSVNYYDESDTLTALTDVYDLIEDDRGFVLLQKPNTSLPSLSDRAAPVEITFDAGFEKAADVPEDLQTAILGHVGSMFRYREAVSPDKVTPTGIYDMLIEPHRRWAV